MTLTTHHLSRSHAMLTVYTRLVTHMSHLMAEVMLRARVLDVWYIISYSYVLVRIAHYGSTRRGPANTIAPT